MALVFRAAFLDSSGYKDSFVFRGEVVENRFRQFDVALYRNGARNIKQLDDNNDGVDYVDVLCKKVVVHG